MNNKFYITTAIAYASGRPHIGNSYEIVLADAIARYKRLVGYDVYLQTGTDEHGQKIEQKALAAGKTPQQYVDEMSEEIKSNWDLLNTTYDAFVRTTDKVHKEKASLIFKRLYDQGDIYLGKYEGLYCTPCESFFTETQLIDGNCPDCGKEVTKATEDAYFFKLNKYVDRLIKHIDDNPDFIEPTARKNEIINSFIKPGLQDLCVSRTSFKWGIPVSFDENHVIYVWIDALSNYITFLGYDENGNHGDLYKKYWPADIQIVGKDILRFHMLYWPIMLMALGEELPKKIYAHSWYLMGEGKMSKSKGNIIYAEDLVNNFGIDAVRYYLLSQLPFANDGLITYDLVIDHINSELANTLGNLISRTIAMANKYFDGIVSNSKISDELDTDLISTCLTTKKIVCHKLDEYHAGEALEEIICLARRCNKYIDETLPWELAKDENNKKRLATVLYNLLESIRYIGVLLQPFMPDTANKIFNGLNTKETSVDSLNNFGGLASGDKVNSIDPLFMRIDKENKLKELNNAN